MPKWCLNYDSGDLEFIDENGFSYSQGEIVFNWDRSAYEEDDDDDLNSQSYNYDTDIEYDEDYSSLLDDDEEEISLLYEDD